MIFLSSRTTYYQYYQQGLAMQKEVIKDWAIPIVLLLILTILFRVFPWDLQLQAIFYSTETGWFAKELSFWTNLYKYGYIPAFVMSSISALALIAGFLNLRLKKLRKIALLILLTMAIGPGLFVNLIFKDNWGRTRPRDIVEFGGTMPYYGALEPSSDKGKSFPSGHASVAFFIFIPYFFLRKTNQKIALIFLLLGLSYGTLAGVGRMAQGGHFASDVIWSCGMVYLCGLGIYYLLRMDKNIYWTSVKNESTD